MANSFVCLLLLKMVSKKDAPAILTSIACGCKLHAATIKDQTTIKYTDSANVKLAADLISAPDLNDCSTVRLKTNMF